MAFLSSGTPACKKAELFNVVSLSQHVQCKEIGKQPTHNEPVESIKSNVFLPCRERDVRFFPRRLDSVKKQVAVRCVPTRRTIAAFVDVNVGK